MENNPIYVYSDDRRPSKLEVVFSKYYDGHPAIVLTEDHYPYCDISCNVGLGMTDVIAFSHNAPEYLLKRLQEAGVLGEVVGQVPSGFVTMPLVRLTKMSLERINQSCE